MKKIIFAFFILIIYINAYGEEKMNWHDNCEFGMHYDLHVGLNESGLGAKITYENLRETLEIIRPDWVQCDCKGHPGVTGWPTKYGTMSKGVVKDAMRIHADVCHDLGIPLGMHYSGVYDVMACEKHPEWEVKNYKGERYDHPVLRSVCPNSPYYDELMIPQLLELIDNYDIDGFWIDGDGWAVLPCYCEKCKKGFIDKYNIEPPISKDDINWHLWCNYHRDLFMNNVKKCADAVHKKKPSCLYISNWMYTYGAPIDESEGTDYISGDLHHIYGHKSALLEGHFLSNRQRDWDLMIWGFLASDNIRNLSSQTKSVLHISQEAALIMSSGGAVMVYDFPHRNGLITPFHSKKYAKVRDFVKARASVNRHSESKAEICVIQSPVDYFEDTKVPDNLFDLNILSPAYLKGIGASQLLSECHYQYDIKTPSMLKDHYNDYKLIIINEQEMFDKSFVSDIEDYVRNGGKLIISGINGIDIFSNLLGVESKGLSEIKEEKAANGVSVVNSMFFVETKDEVASFVGPYVKVKPNSAEIFKYIMNGDIAGDDETNIPFATINKFGKGVVLGVYTELFTNYGQNNYFSIRSVFDDIMKEINIELNLDQIDAPNFVFLTLREKDNNYIVNLVNTGSVASTIDRPLLVEDIPSVSSVKFRLKLDKMPKNVSLIPSNTNIKSYYKDNYLYVEVDDLNIMESVLIEK